MRLKHPRTGKPLNKKVRRRGINLREASRVRKQLTEELLFGDDHGAPNDKTTVRDYANVWLARCKARGERPSTRRLKDSVLERRIFPALGDLYIQGLRRSDVEAWLTDAAVASSASGERELSRVTVNGWLRILKALLAAYYDEHELGASPFARVRPLKEPKRSRDDPNTLPAAILPEFLARMRHHYPQHYAMTYLAVTSGMRWGELSALTWDDIDEAVGVIHVVRSQVNKHVGETKTGESRDIALVDIQIEVLRAHRRRLIQQQAPGLELGLVFPNIRGGYSFPSRLQKPLEHIRKEVGLPHRVTPHGLRRTFNNLLRRAAVDRQVLRSLTGHSSEAMTGLYSTVDVEEQKDAVAVVVGIAGGNRDDQ